MASKPEVTLTFAGDSKDLEKTFDKVGSSSDRMSKDVSSSFDKVGDSADNLDTRAMGFRDTMTGVEDTGKGLSEIMKGNLFDGFLTLGMGIGDLASGVANFGTQFAKQTASFVANTAKQVAAHATAVATTVAGWVVQGATALIAGAQMALAWLIGLGPIGLVILAIVAIIGILVALGVGFDDIRRWAGIAWEFILGAIKGAFNWVKDNWPLILAIITGPIGLAVLAIVRNWDTIKSGFRAVKDFIFDRVADIVGFITGIPGRISGAAKKIGSTIIDGIKSGITSIGGFVGDIASSVKGAINSALHLPFTIHGPGPLPDFTIPSFHTGGTFRAPGGQREGLAMLLDGEKVTRPSAGGSDAVTLIIDVGGTSDIERALWRSVSDGIASGRIRVRAA